MPDYAELVGRQVRETADGWDYQTIGIASTRDDANAPGVGDTGLVTVPVHEFTPTCLSVTIDEMSYPKRFVFIAAWRSPKTRDEA